MIDCITSRFEQRKTQEIERENYLYTHSIKIIEILAEANKNLILGKSITENFADFYKEFVILNILTGWTASRAPENNSIEEINDINNNTDDEEFDTSEQPELQEEIRFFEIMGKSPETITESEQKEIFKIFPTFSSVYLDVVV